MCYKQNRKASSLMFGAVNKGLANAMHRIVAINDFNAFE
jgi:hypothetical protein